MTSRVEEVHTPAAIAEFLARFAPFDALAPVELTAVAAATEPRRYPAAANVLVEDAAPADHLFVVREGAMELVHEGEVVDVLEAGESFGHPSLLTGMAPAFTVRARGDSLCYLVPREQALAVLGRPAGAGFVAATLRERLTRTGHTVHGLPELATVRVRDLVARPPVGCEPGVAIRTAARLMTENGVSALLVRDGERLYLVTDAELRARVIAGELSTENPVSRVVTPAVIVAPDRLAVDAVVELLAAGSEHLVVAEGRDVVGVLSAADLMGLETRSPFALRHAVLRARDEDELVEIAGRLRRLFLALVDSRLPAADVGRVVSLQLDSIVTRLLELGVERHGPAPVPWAWLALGSAARREFTLASDQEAALAYGDGAGEGVDAYFERVARVVDDGLARCGFPPDPNGVVASNRLWRMSASAWEQVFRDCLESPDRSHLIRANVAFDFRPVVGALDVAPRLVAVLRDARTHPDFLRRLARTATDFKPPLGFRGALVVERGGANGGGRLDIKRGGTIPIANLARFFALSNGITISGTADRLLAAEEVGALDHEAATALREAHEIVLRIRLEHHAAQLEAGGEPDNLVDPAQLPPLARLQLREAFRAVAQIQKRLSVYVPLGL